MEETSKKVRHTPGPWSVQAAREVVFGFEARVRVGAVNPGNSICAVFQGGEGALYSTEDHVNANAHLIAAAPSLLEALEDLIKANANPNAANWDYPAAYEAAIKAIKLAKGEIKTELI